MNFSERLQAMIVTTNIPIWIEGRVTRYLSPAQMTGAELAERLTEARAFQGGLALCIQAMSDALNNGETAEQRAARIAAEDADPKAAAQRYGWYAMEDFAALCDRGPNGFYNRIKNCRGQIVRPRAHAAERLRGAGWREYEERHEYWADHFHFADDWAEALSFARKEQAQQLEAKYKEKGI